MRKYLAKLIGTFVLVFVGTATVTIAKGSTLTIGLAFGLAVTVMAYSVGSISGGHFNPAVSLAMLLNHRLGIKDFVGYVISQFVGAILASAIVFDLVHELGLSTKNLGQTDFPNISVGGAFITETLVTFLFVLVIVSVTSKKWGNANFAGLIIGITLALMIIVALNLTGGSLNPARSFGPALFAGGSAMTHYWLYLVAPLVGAVLAAGVGNYLGSEE